MCLPSQDLSNSGRIFRPRDTKRSVAPTQSSSSATPPKYSWQRATLPPRDVAVPSPLKGLTAVFGMGKGVSPSLLPPRKLWLSTLAAYVPSKLHNASQILRLNCRSSPRTISTGQLKTSLPLHTRPIYLIVYEGSYQINSVGDLILR